MKISGQLLSSKPVSLSRAAKLLTRFASVDNGASATVSLYLQRTADAFNHLVQFNNKRSKKSDVQFDTDRKKFRELEADKLEENTDEKALKDSKRKRKRKKDKEVAETTNPNMDVDVDEITDVKSDENQKKKKKKRKKIDDVDVKEKIKKEEES